MISGNRHITVDGFGHIYEVTNMLDRFARPTNDPALAVTCVLKVQGDFIDQDTADVPIYTVH